MNKLLHALFVQKLMEQHDTTDTGSSGTMSGTATLQDDGAGVNPSEPAQESGEGKQTQQPDGKNTSKSLLGQTVNDSADGGKDKTNTPNNENDSAPKDPYGQLTLPDGQQVNQKDFTDFKQLAGELNLSAPDAQRILDFEVQRLHAAAQDAARAWQQQTRDTYGDNLPRALATAARAVESFGGNELRELLDQTGLGNHPVLIEAFRKAGEHLQEDKIVPSNASASGDKTFTQALYGQHSK